MLCFFWLLKKHKQLKLIYAAYFLFTYIIFYGPLLYYKLGFTAYANATSIESLKEFNLISISVFLLNILFFYVKIKGNKYLFYNFFRQISSRSDKSSFVLRCYFAFVFLFCLSYFAFYFNKFPIVGILLNGELGERLDSSGAIPLYITISSIFITIIPSGFFYFYFRINNKFLKIFLFLLTVLFLISGGNKGIVSFFLIFLFYYSTERINILKGVALFIVLFYIYAITKGLSVNAENLKFLLESPFRRVFATQGVGFIGILEMIKEDVINFESQYNLKQQLISFIYGVKLGEGSHPTVFIGEVLAKHGYFVMYLAFFIYLIFTINLIKVVDYFFRGKSGMFITWNVFVFIYLFLMSNLSLANFIRVGFLVLNLLVINFLLRVALKKESDLL